MHAVRGGGKPRKIGTANACDNRNMTHLTGTIYGIVLAIFVAFGVHRMVLLLTYFRHRRRHGVLDRITHPTPPSVCVQCPVYNEPLVVEDLLESVTAIDWEPKRLEIQILDDSTDETSAIIERWLLAHPERAARCRHIRRPERRGYKAGALAEGMRLSRAAFFAVFDADFRPQPDVLNRLMPLFASPRIGAVQARWEFSNRSRSLLTRFQDIFLDAHFLVEQTARSSAGLFFNFNGTAGIWRRAAIESSGGWDADTVTEDLDLSYRAQMSGWRMVYDKDYAVPSELPETVIAFKSQQRRWTKGGVQVFRKHIGKILRSKYSLRQKFEAFFHLGLGFVHIFLALFAIILVPVLILGDQIQSGPTALLNPMLLVLGTGTTVGLYFSGQLFRERHFGRALGTILATPILVAFGMAMSLSCAVAAIEGLFSKGGEFVRTPKGRTSTRVHRGLHRPVIRFGPSLLSGVEISFGIVLAGGALYFAEHDMESIALGLAIKSLGFGGLGLCSLYEFGWRDFFGGRVAAAQTQG